MSVDYFNERLDQTSEKMRRNGWCDISDYALDKPEVFDSLYNEVISFIERNIFLCSKIDKKIEKKKVTRIIEYLQARKNKDSVKKEKLEYLFNLCIFRYMCSLFEFIYVEQCFYDYGLGYSYNDGVNCVLESGVKQCFLNNLFNGIYECIDFATHSYLTSYFNEKFEKEYKFTRRFNYGCGCLEFEGNAFKKEDFLAKIPENYSEFFSKFDLNDERIKNIFIKCLDYWWSNLKKQCRYYLYRTGRLPQGGNGLLRSFSSLDELFKRINEVRMFLGVDPLDVNNEFNELNKPLEKNPTLGIPHMDNNYVYDTGNHDGEKHDFINGWHRVKRYPGDSYDD